MDFQWENFLIWLHKVRLQYGCKKLDFILEDGLIKKFIDYFWNFNTFIRGNIY